MKMMILTYFFITHFILDVFGQQLTIVDINQNENTSNVMTPSFHSPSTQNRLVLIRQLKHAYHNRYINQSQLSFAVPLMQQLNGKVVFNHELPNSDLSKKGRFEFVDLKNDEERATIQKLIHSQKDYFRQKFPTLMESKFIAKEDYIRNSPSSNLRNQKMAQQFINNEKELPFCIMISSFNNARKQLYKRNINSLLQQEYTNYRVLYMDDGSWDNTTETVLGYMKNKFPNYKEEGSWETTAEHGGQTNKLERREFEFNSIKWRFIKNEKNWGGLFNGYTGAVNHCKDNQIAVVYDGDDAFVGTQVFKILNRVYRETQSLFTYTSFATRRTLYMHTQIIADQQYRDYILNEQRYILRGVNEPNNTKRPEIGQKIDTLTTYEVGQANFELHLEMLANKQLRTDDYLFACHILSFYVPLVKKVPIEKLYQQDGLFYRYAFDTAFAVNLAQLAFKRTFFFKEILYEYTANTGLSDTGQNWAKSTLSIRAKSPNDPVNEQQAEEMVSKMLSQ